MTITHTRLYDDYATANQVMRQLEAAGVPASEISIVASNADSWYSATKSKIVTTMVSMTAPTEQPPAPP